MTVAAAHIVLLTENLLLLPPTIDISRMACWVIMQNCSFAIGVKIIAIIFALVGRLALWEAILVDVGSLLVVVINGSRPLSYKGYANKE
jgi:Cd2+/Zn2+-exporting ATPase